MVKSSYELKILEWDEKTQANKQTIKPIDVRDHYTVCYDTLKLENIKSSSSWSNIHYISAIFEEYNRRELLKR